MFGKVMIVLNSGRAIAEMISTNTIECAGRPDPYMIKFATNGLKDVVFTPPNQQWSSARTLFHKFFGDIKRLHNNRHFSEVVFMDEWPRFYKKLNDLCVDNFRPFTIRRIIFDFQSKLISSTLFGKEITDQENILDRIRFLIKISSKIIARLYEHMLYMNPLQSLLEHDSLKTLYKTVNYQKSLMASIFEKCTRSIQVRTNNIKIKNILELMLVKMKIDKDLFDEKHVKNIMTELLFAGTDTVVNAVDCFILYMCLNEDIQERVYTEIIELKFDEDINLDQRKMLPLTEACILETLRLVTMVPLGVFRKTLTEVKIFDFVIPSDTVLIPNYWKVHHDPDLYEDPFKFNPDRFLSDDKNRIIDYTDSKLRYLMPFGGGKRICPARNFTHQLVFLYVANLIKNFKFRPYNLHEPDGDPRNFILNANLQPKSYKIICIKRSSNDSISLRD